MMVKGIFSLAGCDNIKYFEQNQRLLVMRHKDDAGGPCGFLVETPCHQVIGTFCRIKFYLWYLT